ncbi:unnamed protein product [Rangifer tarandus platyrhynchus]|uniref:Uncharacterized protein n=2 Tax=Rangifer tarandus platyrhynchus TaxID=3082113 RepID=A0ABN8YTM9_RANTA|nr:unnamed protein product [Rangifer tarandus platyrhynchus]CAI9702022.1 unnamed protein product [Rangifer tarandus platyrhynchus]
MILQTQLHSSGGQKLAPPENRVCGCAFSGCAFTPWAATGSQAFPGIVHLQGRIPGTHTQGQRAEGSEQEELALHLRPLQVLPYLAVPPRFSPKVMESTLLHRQRFQTSPVSCSVIRKSLAARAERAALVLIHIRFSTSCGSSSNAGDAMANSRHGGALDMLLEGLASSQVENQSHTRGQCQRHGGSAGPWSGAKRLWPDDAPGRAGGDVAAKSGRQLEVSLAPASPRLTSGSPNTWA